MKRVVCVTFGGVLLNALAAMATAGPGEGASALKPAPGCTASGCHLPIGQHERVHQPVAANQCDACHEPRRGATPFQPGPRHEFKRAGDNPELCYACHDRLAERGTAHRPVEMGVCVLCHDPHGSAHAALLRVGTDRRLCVQCHRLTLDQGQHVHPPVGNGDCGACHNPHGSEHGKNLRATPPDLCLDCHDAIEELLDEATVTHDVVTTGRSCVGCHNPHSSDVARLLVGEAMGLCLSCHDKGLDSGEGEIHNMAKDLEDHPNHHGPIRDGNCTACHNPHGGTEHRMLAAAYPVGLYAPYDEDTYALCLECHDVEMLEEERDEEATDFRNGDLNLHYVHVNRKDQGCACGACHDVHAGKAPKHIAGPTPFGDRAILIGFAASATGGSCQTSCHQAWGYDRVSAIGNE